MPLIIAAVTLLSAAAFWYYRLRALGTAAGHAVDAAQRVRGAYRRKRFRHRAESSAYASVDDPATAATVMLLALAAVHGRARPEDEEFVRSEVGAILPPGTLAETFVFAQWLAAQATDPNDLSLRFSKLWLSALSPDERLDFYRMAERVVASTAPPEGPTDLQRQSLTRLKDRLGLFRV